MEPEAWKQNKQVCILIKNIFKLNIQVFLTKNKIENVENMDGMYYRKQNNSYHSSKYDVSEHDGLARTRNAPLAVSLVMCY